MHKPGLFIPHFWGQFLNDKVVDNGHIVECKKIVLKPGKLLEDDMCWLATYKKMGDQILINKNRRNYITSCSKSCLAPNEAFVILLHQVTELVIVTLFHLTLTVFCDNVSPKLINSYFANIFFILVYSRILHYESRWSKKL